MDVSIGRCAAGEIDDVLRFIDQHWKRGHILTTCRPLLDWQYRDADGAGYAFVLARRRSDSALLGILGYLATKRFDPSLTNANVVWLTTWKVRDDAGVAGLGIRLLQYLASIEPHVAIGAVGVTPSTLPIYQALGYAIGELQHYVRPNADVDRFELASIRSRQATASGDPLADGRRLVTDEDFDLGWESPSDWVPSKTLEYFRQRYANHPVYRYVIESIVDQRAIIALLAARVAEHNGHRALRIVDFVGSPDAFSKIGRIIQKLLEEFGAEYADVYNAGISEDVFAQAGFWKVDPDGPEIVPDHFEPFERRNVRLWYAIKGGGDAILFKADGDQDRPNDVPRRFA